MSAGVDCKCSKLTAVAGESEHSSTFHVAHLFASKLTTFFHFTFSASDADSKAL